MAPLFPLPKVLPPSDGCGDSRETFLSSEMHVTQLYYCLSQCHNSFPGHLSIENTVGVWLCLRPSHNDHSRQLAITMSLLPRTFIATPLRYPNPTPELVICHNYSGLEILKSNICIKPDRFFQFPTIIIPVLQNYEKQLTGIQTTFKIMLILLPNSLFPS